MNPWESRVIKISAVLNIHIYYLNARALSSHGNFRKVLQSNIYCFVVCLPLNGKIEEHEGFEKQEHINLLHRTSWGSDSCVFWGWPLVIWGMEYKIQPIWESWVFWGEWEKVEKQWERTSVKWGSLYTRITVSRCCGHVFILIGFETGMASGLVAGTLRLLPSVCFPGAF